MNLDDLIKGKVARILNAREVAVNIGSEDGVRKGMIFDVLDGSGQEIKDPDSGQILGSIERHKIKLKATIVQDRISVLSTYKTKEINVGGQFSLGIIGNAFLPPKYIQQPETLKSSDKKFEKIDEKDSIVQVGDIVRQESIEITKNTSEQDA